MTIGREAKIARFCAGVVSLLSVLVMFAMMLHVTVNALLRTYAGRPLPWTFEWVQFWYVPVLALLGFVAAQRGREHIATDVFLRFVPIVARPWFVAGGWLLAALCAAGITLFSWDEAVGRFEVGASAGTSDIPVWPVYFVVPVVFIVLTGQFIAAMLSSLGEAVEIEGEQEQEVLRDREV